MFDVLVLGGGFAGMWSAAGAARLLHAHGADHTVALLSPDADLTIRPRLYQADPDTMRVPLDRVLGPIGVRRITARATAIDTGRRRVTATTTHPDGRTTEDTYAYGRLVLATGSRLVRPALPGAEHLHDIDTRAAADALERHLHTLPELPAHPGRFTAVVVGAGFTGLEIATELVGRLRKLAAPLGAEDEVRVVLVERADAVGPDLGAAPRPLLTRALEELAVHTRLGVTVERLDGERAALSDGTLIPARTVVWTAGVRADALTEAVPAERDRLGRLAVDRFLRVTGVPGVYAAGDTAAAEDQEGHPVTQSCQHAIPLGKTAGHNVVADLLGLPPVPFAPDPYTTCLDLGEAGALSTTGWDRIPRDVPEGWAKSLKRDINEKWIYPPVDDAEAIRRAADPRSSTRQPLTFTGA
ncbi:FAD-dependent oxidoreductase [Streptomyces sp. NPDC003077]|uniref:NAD(P)/FAD-dependent oxidoreductase n=1 Tax=Streptomyces sp. NPDC003077 TaxID=3154443 RepID=UPI0033A38A57